MADKSDMESDMAANDSLTSSNSDNDWSFIDCLDIYLTNKQEIKGTLYGHIDGERDYRKFVKKLDRQGLRMEELTKNTQEENENGVDELHKLKYIFELKVADTCIKYGSPFAITEDKTLLCTFKTEDIMDDFEFYDKKTKMKSPDTTVKLTVKQIKLFENYKILRENVKLCEKRQMISILVDALTSPNPPVPLIRYVIGVVGYHHLQGHGGGNVRRPYVKKHKKDIVTEKSRGKRKSKSSDKDVSSDVASMKPSKKSNATERTIKDTNQKQLQMQNAQALLKQAVIQSYNNPEINSENWSNAEALLNISANTLNVGMSNVRTLNNAVSTAIEGQPFINGDSCILNELPIISESDINIHTAPNLELHTVPSLEMHTGPSVELSSEAGFSTPHHNSNFNIHVSPNLNLDLSTKFGFSSRSPKNSSLKISKKLKKKKKKNKELLDEAPAEENGVSNIKITASNSSNLKVNSNPEALPTRQKNGTVPQLRPARTSTKQINEIVNHKKRKSMYKRVYNLEEIVKAQENLRENLKSLNDLSFKCDDVQKLEDISQQLLDLKDDLHSSLPPPLTKKRKER